MERLSDVALKTRICPRRVLWPKAESSPLWAAAHDCVHAYENVVRDVEFECIALERDKNLSAQALRSRRAQISENKLARLVEFRPLENAQASLSERIRALKSLSDRTPKQVEELQQLRQALKDVQEGIEATKRTILELCRVRLDVPA